MMNLYLIGYRGSGKSTVAQKLSLLMDWPLVSTDVLAAEKTNLTIRQIFETFGEEYFRDLESEVIESVSHRSNTIVDLGGGAMMRKKNQESILNSGIVVWLRAEPAKLWQRIKNDPQSTANRPKLTNAVGLAEVKQLLELRNPVYAECAEFSIDTDELSVEEVAQQVVCHMESSR